MKIEPLLDKPALIETIRQAYGYPVENLVFIPAGFVGQHYVTGAPLLCGLNIPECDIHVAFLILFSRVCATLEV